MLLEVGTEDLPPRDIIPALEQLRDAFRARLGELRIDFGDTRVFGTPRRLVIYCTGMSTRQKPALLSIKGPPHGVAFDEQGNPTQAAIGFAKSVGVSVSQLVSMEEASRRYIYAFVKKRGRKSKAALRVAIPEILESLSFSKTMRWDGSGATFARPVRWIVALLGDEVIRFTFAGVRANRVTHGHRFLGKRRISLQQAEDYLPAMQTDGILVDPQQRRKRIIRQATKLSSLVRGVPVLDQELLDEIAMSVEYPTALRGNFSPVFRSLPRLILTTVMQHHQKYFSIEDHNGNLLSYFITVRDGGGSGSGQVTQGHQWVLAARLADARFFLDQDRKHSLEYYVPLLEGVTVYAKLGTMADKVHRLVRLADYLAVELVLDGRSAEALRTAAKLCKADLVSHVVREFPELQGLIGGLYAEMDGESADVCKAIREHYKPVGATDNPPSSFLGGLLSLSDRCDNIMAAIELGLMPTGSEDPYALRRAALGVVQTILLHKVPLRLGEFLTHVHVGLRERGFRGTFAYISRGGRPASVDAAIDFLRQRLRALLLDRGIRYDVADAALAVSADDFIAAEARAAAMHGFLSDPGFGRVFVAYDRASRILTAEGAVAIDPALFEHPAERNLALASHAATPAVTAAADAGDYTAALRALVPLAEPVDRLFDAVLVNSPDPRVRANRQALLREVVDVFRRVGDFAKIVMEGRD